MGSTSQYGEPSADASPPRSSPITEKPNAAATMPRTASSTATSVTVTRSRPPLAVMSSAPTRRRAIVSARFTASMATRVSGRKSLVDCVIARSARRGMFTDCPSVGIDEYFVWTDTSGASALLADPLGSTVALTDTAGAVQTQYTYEPFGQTSATGTANSNPFPYTGRENDGTGLYYYRARYYYPRAGPFHQRGSDRVRGRRHQSLFICIQRTDQLQGPSGPLWPAVYRR